MACHRHCQWIVVGGTRTFFEVYACPQLEFACRRYPMSCYPTLCYTLVWRVPSHLHTARVAHHLTAESDC